MHFFARNFVLLVCVDISKIMFEHSIALFWRDLWRKNPLAEKRRKKYPQNKIKKSAEVFACPLPSVRLLTRLPEGPFQGLWFGSMVAVHVTPMPRAALQIRDALILEKLQSLHSGLIGCVFIFFVVFVPIFFIYL